MLRPLYSLMLCGLIGCGPADLVVLTDDYAVELDGSGCMRASGEAVPLGNAITVEAWVRADPNPAQAQAGLIALDEDVLLWADATSIGLTEASTEPQTGLITQRSLFDGARHHLAGVWVEDEEGALYIDGLPAGLGSTLELPDALHSFAIGCWPSAGWGFEGVVDEVRISLIDRYTGPFEAVPQPLEADEITAALWHLDSGVGQVGFEETEQFDLQIEGGSWVRGLVSPARAGGDTGEHTGDPGAAW